MENLKTRAYAKINLALDVLEKLDDGYHRVNMVMQSIDIFDDIDIKLIKGGRIEAYTNRSYIPSDMKNLACRAAAEYMAAAGIEGYGVSMRINKRIPVCAGMGGGSSDAAAVIRALDGLFGSGMSDEQLAMIGRNVGSDVVFCLFGGTMIAKEKGDVLQRIPDLPDAFITVCKPSFSVSTPALFSRIDSCKIKRHPDIEGMVEAIEKGDIGSVARRCYNVFEDVLPNREQRIVDNIKGIMLSCGALGAAMTGTGSAVYGIFKDEKLAESAVHTLRREYTQCFLARNVKKLS